MSKPSGCGRTMLHEVAFLLLCLFALLRLVIDGPVENVALMTGWLAIDSVRRETVTYDEPLHLIAGYSFWKFDDYRLQLSHGALPRGMRRRRSST